MSSSRVKNEIHCRVEPAVMQHIINQSKLNNCSVSDICRLLIKQGMQTQEMQNEYKARILLQRSPSLHPLLELLHNTLDDFEYTYEPNKNCHSWSFGMFSSDVDFETADECLLHFLSHLNTLTLDYDIAIAEPAVNCVPECFTKNIEADDIEW